MQYEEVFSAAKIETLITHPGQHFRTINDETQSLNDITFSERHITEAVKDVATNSAALTIRIPAIFEVEIMSKKPYPNLLFWKSLNIEIIQSSL